jgi:hypothetical protein
LYQAVVHTSAAAQVVRLVERRDLVEQRPGSSNTPDDLRGARFGNWVLSLRRQGVHMSVGSGIRFTVWLTTVCVGAVLALAAYAATSTLATGIMAAALVSVVTLAVAFSLAAAIRMVNQWQRAIVLRLGKFSSVAGLDYSS